MSVEKPDVITVDNRDNVSDSEKGPVVREIDNIRVLGMSDEDADFYLNFGAERAKKLLWKVRVTSLV